jgi:serine/threonine-protein kinase RsbW
LDENSVVVERQAKVSVKPRQRLIEIHNVAELSAARGDLGSYLDGYNLPPGTIYDLLTCLQEAAKNALRFAASPLGVQISVTVGSAEVTVTVRDHGPGLDLTGRENPRPDPLSESGRGLFLLQALMDEVEFHVEDGTEVRLRKRRQGCETVDFRAA